MAKTKLIVLDVQDKPGAVAAATAALSDAGVNIQSIFGFLFRTTRSSKCRH